MYYLLTIFGEYFGIKNCATLPDKKNCTYVCMSGRHLFIQITKISLQCMNMYLFLFWAVQSSKIKKMMQLIHFDNSLLIWGERALVHQMLKSTLFGGKIPPDSIHIWIYAVKETFFKFHSAPWVRWHLRHLFKVLLSCFWTFTKSSF